MTKQEVEIKAEFWKIFRKPFKGYGTFYPLLEEDIAEQIFNFFAPYLGCNQPPLEGESHNPVESSNMKTEKLDFIDLIKKLKAVEISHDQSEQGTYESGYEAAKMDTSKIYTQLQSKPVEGYVRSASIDIGEKALLIYRNAYMPSKREASRTIIDALLSKYNFTRKG